MTPDKNVNAVIEKHVQRVAKGVAKYRTTTCANPLSIAHWLTHFQEECMDAAIYAEAAKTKLAELLNRRVEVEQAMLDAANGKRPMPDARTLRLMALALGTPKHLWSDDIRAVIAGGAS